MNAILVWHSDLVLLALLVAANGAPVVAEIVCVHRCAWPIDALFGQGRIVFGHHKTVRGVFAGVLGATFVGWCLGSPLRNGIAVGALAMAGDLISSFCKRRMGIAPGAQVLGLDQIPESLMPALTVVVPLGLGVADVTVVIGGFCVLELTLSRLRYRRAPDP